MGACGPVARPPVPPSRHSGCGHPSPSWHSTAAQLAPAAPKRLPLAPSQPPLGMMAAGGAESAHYVLPTGRLQDGGCVAARRYAKTFCRTLLSSPSAAGSRAYLPKGACETSSSECPECCVGVKAISGENAQQPVRKTGAGHQL